MTEFLRGHEWYMASRDASYAPDETLPISSAKIVRKHMGVSRATITTPYSPERYASLVPPGGVLIYRDGRQEFSGSVEELDFTWDASTGTTLIQASCAGDEHHLADRIAFPDPLRAPDDQTVNTHWRTRGTGGIALSVPASTGMMRLISDQAGPTARPDRRVPGLILGTDPGIGETRVWTALFDNVMTALQSMSIASGANLGIRATSSVGSITYDIVTPRDLQGEIRFSADLLNVAGTQFKITAPTATNAVAAGQGDFAGRMRRHVASTNPDTLQWSRQIWKYVDRRDTADPIELETAARDTVAEGEPTVSLAVTLRESEATTYGRDWDLGDRVTVYVGLPGESKIGEVTDVVREILLEVDGKGNESIRPAIGSYDANTLIPSKTQQQLREVQQGLAGLVTRK